MSIRIKYFIIILVSSAITFLSGCSGQSKKNSTEENDLVNLSGDSLLVDNSPLANFNWLLGEWSNEAKGQMIGEYWTKTNDSLYEGTGFGLKGTDTTFKESLQLLMVDGEIYYVPTVIGQNDDQPVLFKIIDVGQKSIMCENIQHDVHQLNRYILEAH